MQKSLKDLAEVILGYGFRSAISNNPNSNFFVLQAKNISSDCRLITNYERTEFKKSYAKYFLHKNDVILTNRGSFRSAVYKDDSEKIIATSSVYIIRVKKNSLILPEYLSIFLNSQHGQSIMKNLSMGATISSLSKSSLMDVEIPIPPIKKQELIIKINQNQDEWVESCKKRTNLYQKISKNTINKLITS